MKLFNLEVGEKYMQHTRPVLQTELSFLLTKYIASMTLWAVIIP